MIKVGFDVSPLESGSKFRGVGMYTKRLLEYLEKDSRVRVLEFTDGKIPKEADLVHYPYFFPFSAFLPLCLSKKFVVTVHDLIPLVFPRAYPPGLKGGINYAFQKRRLKKASMIITDSQSSANDIVKFMGYPSKKVQVVYLAGANRVERILDKDFLQAVQTKFNLPKSFVLFVGDVNYNKNLSRLVKACRLVKTPLVIVGKQSVSRDFDKNHIENQPLVELNNLAKEGNDIITTGFVDEKELAALYSLASVYCQPSLYEGFGVPLLEAMACGCPVVTSNVSSLPEIVGKAAILVDPENPENISRGLLEMIRDKKIRDKYIKLGFERIKMFSWEKTAEETINVYEKVLNMSFVLSVIARERSDRGDLS